MRNLKVAYFDNTGDVRVLLDDDQELAGVETVLMANGTATITVKVGEELKDKEPKE